jgi:hypothetical protein
MAERCVVLSKKKKSETDFNSSKPVFRSQPEMAANDSGGGIFKGDEMKSKGRSPDIKPWPGPPGTFFFLARRADERFGWRSDGIGQRVAYRWLIGT